MPAGRPFSSPRRVPITVGDRTVLMLVPEARRVRVGLVMPVVERIVDISVQPVAAVAALDEAARLEGISCGAVHRAAIERVSAAADTAGAWRPTATPDLTQVIGGSSFAMLAAAYDLGAAPVGEVPRWAAAILAAPTIGEAAHEAFGTMATKPVRRALVGALSPIPCGAAAGEPAAGPSGRPAFGAVEGPAIVDFAVLALALVGSGALQPDRLARVLAAERVAQPFADLPDRATLTAARRTVATWGAQRVERLMIEAAGRPDGLRLLLATAALAGQLHDHGPPSLPNRLDDLHDAHCSLVRSAAVTSHPLMPRTHHGVTQSGTARSGTTGSSARLVGSPLAPPPPQVPHRSLAAPTATAGSPRVVAATPIPHSPTIRALDGLDIDVARSGDIAGRVMPVRLTLPHVVGDLHRWGRTMSNCLGDFGPAVAAGRVALIGVQRSGRLSFVVELSRNGEIRQCCGQANRRPDDASRRAVFAALCLRGVIDARAYANAPWLIDLAADATGHAIDADAR